MFLDMSMCFGFECMQNVCISKWIKTNDGVCLEFSMFSRM